MDGRGRLAQSLKPKTKRRAAAAGLPQSHAWPGPASGWRRAGAPLRRSHARTANAARRRRPRPPRCCCSPAPATARSRAAMCRTSSRRCRTSATPPPTAPASALPRSRSPASTRSAASDILDARRHHRALLAAVPRRRADARAAADQSVDRRRHGAQALSRPAAHRDHGAQAFALWQKDGRVALIAADGTVLEPTVPRRFAALPQVVGTRRRTAARGFPRAARALSGHRATRSTPRCWSPSGAGTCI